MTGAMRSTLVAAFRRAALPLGWYYTVTLGLPLANGAAQSRAAFLSHALAVIVVPPILIVLLCTIHKTAQTFAGACRSAWNSRTPAGRWRKDLAAMLVRTDEEVAGIRRPLRRRSWLRGLATAIICRFGAL